MDMVDMSRESVIALRRSIGEHKLQISPSGRLSSGTKRRMVRGLDLQHKRTSIPYSYSYLCKNRGTYNSLG